MQVTVLKLNGGNNMKIKEVENKKIYVKILQNSLVLLLLAAAFALPANAALQAVSPTVNPANGYPDWYRDVTGMGLQLCLGTNLDGTGPADPRCILGFTTVTDIRVNASIFPDESFYSFAEAPLIINGNAGRFRLLTEAAFAVLPPAPPVNGQQITFTRASLFTSQQGAFPPNSTFHVVYPFGAFDFSTDAIGDFINPPGPGPFPFLAKAKEMRAEDGPGAALDFAFLLPGTNTGITTFLKSTTLNIPGYIGDGVTATPVTGGTNGNVVTITRTAGLGPFTVVGGNDWIVAGKIFNFGNISGFKVNSATGAGIPGWNITLKNQTFGTVINTTTTNAQGYYEFLNLLPGTYNVTEETRPGFRPDTATFRVVPVGLVGVPNQNFTNFQILPGLAMTVDAPAKTTSVGVPATYTLTLNNTGNAIDTYTLTASASTPAGATVTLNPPASIQIINGFTGSVLLNVSSSPAIGDFFVTVTAASQANPALTASQVTHTTVVGIVVTPNTAMLKNGTTQQFTAGPANVMPVTWTSSVPSVGTIDPNTGLFTAVGSGTTAINATNTTLGLSGTAVVTVGANLFTTQAFVPGYNMIIIPVDPPTVLMASGLVDLVTAQTGVAGLKVVKWDPSTQTFMAFDHATGLTDFPIVPGQSYFIKVPASTAVGIKIAGTLVGGIV